VEDVVTLHMLAQLKDQPKIVFLDTGRFDQETYDLIERCRERFDFDLTVYTPKHKSLGRLLSDYGLDPAASHAEYGRQCCAVRKAEPLRRALQGADAWLSGIRRDQDPAQTHGGILQIDQVHGGILKIHPLYQWSRQEVWDYLHEHKLPYHKCYDEGFSRIECAPCIRLATEQNDHGARSHWWEPGAEPEAPTQLSRMTVVQVS
jgi:phosphoadenosine phosphosulfate reductase